MSTTQEDLKALKEQADSLGLSYHANIGYEKLKEKVEEAIAAEATEDTKEEVKAVKAPKELTRKQIKDEATKLVRVNISCMNPAKREWDGEFITVNNSAVGTLTKFVKFNTSEGYHIPHMIYQMLKDRECQIFVESKGPRGIKIRKGKIIKEFAIEVLPPLTKEELAELARRQAMAGAID